ncbi:MAG TPA: S8/S53 family peptidase [Solirubrobacteraceae bacterium]|nr:S8/S53 family peptidase [Solirubrobacteraceae bacterium]
MNHPSVAHTVQGDVLVFVMRGQLLVRAGAVDQLRAQLEQIAEPVASLGGAGGLGAGYGRPEQEPPASRAGDSEPSPELPDDRERFDLGEADVQLWRLRDQTADPIDIARRLSEVVEPVPVPTDTGDELLVPAVSPNHLCVVAKPNICPAGPPGPIPPPLDAGWFVEPCGEEEDRAHVVVIDTGYIYARPRHHELDRHVRSVRGTWFDPSLPGWRWCPPDVRSTDGGYELDGIAGHGTFIAGLIGHHCRRSRITVVGQRHDVVWVGPNPGPAQQAMLFSTEFDVAHALLRHSRADVISCGFAFPTLDNFPSIPFTGAMTAILDRFPGVAVASPAGNEETATPYWPAAHPDVIGVAAANRLGNARAWFSNWGDWVDVCTRGQDVWSTYVDWTGRVEGYPSYETLRFRCWADWDGTSFATPKVAGAIARRYVDAGGTPLQAYQDLIGGATPVLVTELADGALTADPVSKPNLHLH